MKDHSAAALSIFTVFIAYTTLSTVVRAKEHTYFASQEYPAFEPATSEDSKTLLGGRFPQETVVTEATCKVLMIRSDGLEDEFDLFQGGKKVFRGSREEAMAERERLGCL